jgi:putative hemolysin
MVQDPSLQGEEAPEKLIDLEASVHLPVLKNLVHLFGKPLESILSIKAVNRLYDETRENYKKDSNFFRACAKAFRLDCHIPPGDLERIPRSGPLIVVSNHPFGGLDAIALGVLLTEVRDDVKMMANFLLNKMPETRDWFIPVDPFGRDSSPRQNIQSMRKSMEWLKSGGLLAIFPAGEVSHFHWHGGRIEDPAWSPHVAALARKTDTTVLPVFFDGRNSLFFQVSGLVHARLRTLLLARELEARRTLPIRAFIGRPIGAAALNRHETDEARIRYLRSATYFLKTRRYRKPLYEPESNGKSQHPILPGQSVEALRADIQKLGPDNLLYHSDPYSVYIARAHEIPHVLAEIGRLRELTFREVGEGTGQSSDLDRYDYHYLHLFLWNESSDHLVGAYRLGLTDELLNRDGIEGIYSASLFKFKPKFLKQLGPAIELGRSFIVSEYQRSYNGLMLLWLGIGHWIARHPQYYHLLGPVSITADYHPISQRLMIRFLKEHLSNRKMARMVKAKTPPRHPHLMGMRLRDISSRMASVEDVSAMVSFLEKDSKGVPILLKHYLKMNARLLSFNVDPDFSNVLDGLMLLDLRTSGPKLLRRFMGTEGYEKFCAYHQLEA